MHIGKRTVTCLGLSYSCATCDNLTHCKDYRNGICFKYSYYGYPNNIVILNVVSDCSKGDIKWK